MKLQTLNEMLRNSVNLYGERTAFKVKKDGKFTPITYQEFYKKVEIFGTGLLSIGMEKFDNVGLVSDNRFEWIISDMAIIGSRMADVPCSGNSSPQDIYFKLNHSDAKATILEGEMQFSNFYKIAKDLPKIKNKNKHIYLSSEAKKILEKYLEENIENLLKETHSKDAANSIKNSLINRAVVIDGQYNQTHSHKIYSFEKINKIGEDLLARGDVSFSKIAKSDQPDDLATIIYTSGTTSDPKGVMLTNANFMHNAINAPIAITINKDDNFLSVLPSWHVYERTVEYCALIVGASTAYSKPFKQVLLPDLITEKPSVMVSVPRIWESLYIGILSNIKKGSSLQQHIFNWAINLGEKYKKAEGIINGTWPLFNRPEYTPEELAQARRTVQRMGWKYRLADKIVFKKIRKLTGGRFRFAISGGGALNESIDKFFNAIGLIITEGYGLTETSPILAGRTKKDNIMFTVGPPLPEVEIKIVDKDNLEKELPNGEIGIVLVKGPSLP